VTGLDNRAGPGRSTQERALYLDVVLLIYLLFFYLTGGSGKKVWHQSIESAWCWEV
jgi:hypothetical protein